MVPGKSGAIRLVEAKASRTVTPDMAASMQRLADAARKASWRRQVVEMFLVHRPSRSGTVSRAVAPGVQALPWEKFVAEAIP